MVERQAAASQQTHHLNQNNAARAEKTVFDTVMVVESPTAIEEVQKNSQTGESFANQMETNPTVSNAYNNPTNPSSSTLSAAVATEINRTISNVGGVSGTSTLLHLPSPNSTNFLTKNNTHTPILSRLQPQGENLRCHIDAEVDEVLDDAGELDDDRSPFEMYYEDQSQVKPKHKIKLLMACAIAGVIEGFTWEHLQQEPFDVANLGEIKPVVEVIKGELKRRDPKIRGVTKKTPMELIEMLRERNNVLTDGCRYFIESKFEEVKEGFSLRLR